MRYRTHADDVIEAMQRGVPVKEIRQLGVWYEYLYGLEERFNEYNAKLAQVKIIDEIALALGIPALEEVLHFSPDLGYGPLIQQCQSEIRYRLTGHSNEEIEDL